MKFKQLAIASALAALSVPALATPLYGPGLGCPGTACQSSTIAHAPGATAFGGAVIGPAASFSDVFNFSVDVAGDLGISLNTSSTANPLYPIFPFLPQYTLHLTSLAGQFSGSPSTVILPTNTTYHFAVAAGQYQLTVSGVADGMSGGGYNGSMTLAVPEPESYAMFLAGIGLLGMIVRRRTALV